MGRRGPKPKPKSLLLEQGSKHAKYERPDELTLPVEIPETPDMLTDDARVIWDRLVKRLEELGIVHALDEGMLVRYCAMYDRWRKAQLFLNKAGDTYVVKGKDGVKRQEVHPQVRIVRDLNEQMIKIELQLGMSPVARTSLPALPDPYAGMDFVEAMMLASGRN